ncbi:MAG TPA: phage virion morphogenesis protein [Solirubrobacterales bacterium]|jgi:hypothetical protein
MPLQTVRFDVAGDVQYARAFEAAAKEAEDLSEPLGQVGDAVLRDVFEQFRTEGTFGHGSKWKELSPGYAEWKRQQVGEEPILVFKGTTRDAMIARSAVSVSPRRMVYDPKAPKYALRHQQGEDGMPQRKMVEIPETDRRQWDRYFVEWLNSIRREKLAGL